jgi:hypothetical protein
VDTLYDDLTPEALMRRIVGRHGSRRKLRRRVELVSKA